MNNLTNKRIIAVIGGGAAGFFAAIHAAASSSANRVLLLEKTTKLLTKVSVSGGGRCNVTHACFSIADMSRCYPRGSKAMKKLLGRFMTTDTIRWFEDRGVPLKTEADGRMFPVSDSSQSIVDCLLNEARRLGVEILTQQDIRSIEPETGGGFILQRKNMTDLFCHRVIVATGGSPKEEGLHWLQALGHSIESPVPSLFTFNMPSNPVRALQGLSVPQVKARIAGTKLTHEGPILITHWGMSGPVVLKLSAWGARLIEQMDYRFQLHINWLATVNEQELRTALQSPVFAARKLGNYNPWGLPARLWLFLLGKIEINPDKRWNELGKTDSNRLINTLLNDEYPVQGKTTFKEEFVTCGGIALQDIDLSTMQSRHCPHLYFAGEVTDIDGITGGFNFQAAWSSGFVAGTSAGT
jgi:predicted Rossmann fold flavoprotein